MNLVWSALSLPVEMYQLIRLTSRIPMDMIQNECSLATASCSLSLSMRIILSRQEELQSPEQRELRPPASEPLVRLVQARQVQVRQGQARRVRLRVQVRPVQVQQAEVRWALRGPQVPG